MKSRLSIAAALLASGVLAATVPDPSCFDGKVRISALISSGGSVRVGIVETATRASYLVSPGQTAGDVEVLEADYDRETVVLRWRGETCTLNLSSDPDAIQYAQNLVPPPENIYRGEAIEAFLRENPNAVQDGIIKFPLPVMPDAVGKGEGIERFLREHPELAAQADQEAVGKGEGIEKFLRENPDIKVQDEIPEGSFGSGIDAELKRLGLKPGDLAPGIPEDMRN